MLISMSVQETRDLPTFKLTKLLNNVIYNNLGNIDGMLKIEKRMPNGLSA